MKTCGEIGQGYSLLFIHGVFDFTSYSSHWSRLNFVEILLKGLRFWRRRILFDLKFVSGLLACQEMQLHFFWSFYIQKAFIYSLILRCLAVTNEFIYIKIWVYFWIYSLRPSVCVILEDVGGVNWFPLCSWIYLCYVHLHPDRF